MAELVAQAGEAESSARLSAAADLLLTAARLSPAGAAQDGLLLDAIDLLLRAGEPAEAAIFAEQLAAMPSTVQRTLVQARWAAMEGRHNQVDMLARSVWSEGDAAERASAAAMLAQLAVLRNDNTGAVRWAQEAARDGDAVRADGGRDQVRPGGRAGNVGGRDGRVGLLGEPVGGDASAEVLATNGILRMVDGD